MKKDTELLAPGEKKRGAHRLWLLAVLLAAGGLLLWLRLGQPSGGVPQPGTSAQPPQVQPTPPPQALTARQQREAAYEKDLAAVQALVMQTELREETRQQAAAQAAEMIRQHQLELGLEQALVSAGFAPCLVLMQNDALTVAVSASEVTAAESAVILSVCLEHTDVASENIRIMPGVL
ncbi:MAG: SpoIIIAH-like family protein [Clostridiales bacterium]|nr:SpoIIIAH-like family protein [Clostridiales bacterium]